MVTFRTRPALNGVPLALGFAAVLSGTSPAHAADELLFCNRPETIRKAGSHADAVLKPGRSYRVFYHYKNGTGATAPLVVSFKGAPGTTITLLTRKGIADPHPDPPHAGRQAMARFLKAREVRYGGKNSVRLPIMLRPGQVASGVLRVEIPGPPPSLDPTREVLAGLEQKLGLEPPRVDRSVRMRIYFRNDRYTVAGARVVSIPSPRRDFEVVLNQQNRSRYFRIGIPEPELRRQVDGAYGLIYSFKVSAPAGRKVRVAFSPRGGQAGLVGTVNGAMRQSRIVETSAWTVFTDAVVGKNGMVLTTLPFGGVFYPVELAFRLL